MHVLSSNFHLLDWRVFKKIFKPVKEVSNMMKFKSSPMNWFRARSQTTPPLFELNYICMPKPSSSHSILTAQLIRICASKKANPSSPPQKKRIIKEILTNFSTSSFSFFLYPSKQIIWPDRAWQYKGRSRMGSTTAPSSVLSFFFCANSNNAVRPKMLERK